MTEETLPKSSIQGDYQNMSAPLGDWITEFLLQAKDVNSPQIFKTWAAIATLSAAMERKCYLYFRTKKIYPNMFIGLISPPRGGKTNSIQQAEDLCRNTKKLHLAPNKVSAASLIDCLAGSRQSKPLPEGGLFEYF